MLDRGQTVDGNAQFGSRQHLKKDDLKIYGLRKTGVLLRLCVGQSLLQWGELTVCILSIDISSKPPATFPHGNIRSILNKRYFGILSFLVVNSLPQRYQLFISRLGKCFTSLQTLVCRANVLHDWSTMKFVILFWGVRHSHARRCRTHAVLRRCYFSLDQHKTTQHPATKNDRHRYVPET